LLFFSSSPSPNKVIQVTTAFASALVVTHLAEVVFEAGAVLGAFAADLLTGRILARADKRGRNKRAKPGATIAFPP
jgi:hypothetical protein